MTDREEKKFRRLKRVDLLELLISQTRENDQLREELAELRAQLDEREIALEEAGSIAEAALKVNEVFQAAQAAADQYIQSVKKLGIKKEEKLARMEQDANERAAMCIEKAEAEARRIIEEAVSRRDAMLAEIPELKGNDTDEEQ